MKGDHLVILLAVVLASGVLLWSIKDGLFDDELPPDLPHIPCCGRPEWTEADYKACEKEHKRLALEMYRRERREEARNKLRAERGW